MVKKFENKQQTCTNMKSAFTLAEVLITLAIIGVIAAMTLPTLIQKHQKRVLGERFKQSLSILSQGFQKMMADEEVTDFYETTLGQSNNWNMNRRLFEKYFKVAGDFGDDPINAKLDAMYESTDKAVAEYCDSHGEKECDRYALEHFSKIDEEVNKAFNGESDLGSSVVSLYQSVDNIGFDPLMLFMQNGLTIGGMHAVRGHEPSRDKLTGYSLNEIFLLIDTNGNAKPNKAGYDRFIVSILDTGLVVPFNHQALLSKYIMREVELAAVSTCRFHNDFNICQEKDNVVAMVEDVMWQWYEYQINYTLRYDVIQSHSPRGKYTITKDDCKSADDKFKCGDYLYRNNFVMDY